MSLHHTTASVLLAWVNSLKLGDAVTSVSQFQDCSLFLNIIGKIHGTEEGEDVSQKSVAERVTEVVGFLQKIFKHKVFPQGLVSREKLLAAEEMELAKVVMLLLYSSSMSDKIPREWTTLEYGLQTEMAKFLDFMLYNEDCLSEDLENFLQKKMPASSRTSSTSSEVSTPPKRGMLFLKLHKIASSSTVKLFPGSSPSSSSSPMGEIMRTPQFQIRRLKKLLEAERQNRDELKHELAESQKLLDEKDARMLRMQQRIDRLTLLQERHAAADQLEPKEMEELRDKNESLLLRLQETVKQNRDLKTEKGQVDRKNSQLSKDNGDLAFQLREYARAFKELQEALNEISRGQDKSLEEWEERRSRLEADLHGALSEKRCLEEKMEILQGKISVLEDQLAKETSALPVTAEVLGDVLKVDELKKKLAQQEKAGQTHQQKAKVREEGLRSETNQLKEKTADLQAQLLQKEQAADHYKAQMEKAWKHYDGKKQHLLEKLKGLEHLEKENAELKADSERLAKELQHAMLKATESELSLKNLASQVWVLQAQLDFLDHHLRGQGKVQAARETLEGRETFRQSSADISTDSLELNTSDEGQPLISTRMTHPSFSESEAVESSKTSQQLPHKGESPERLNFTPIPTRSPSKLENKSNVTLDSGRKGLSGHQRTTQLVNIDTVIKKHPKQLDINESFVSLRSSNSGESSQETVKTRLRPPAASSSRSLASLPSQESLITLSAASPDGTSGHAALKSLPGYRPTTLRHSQGGSANTGPNSCYATSCDDEPQLDGWNRIAELQQRNRIRPPHLKSCYPVESLACPPLTTITDEDLMTGDPEETLRRAHMLPSQIVKGSSTRRSPGTAARGLGGAATRRKRLLEEPQTGTGTPEVKKSSTCFAWPQTPKGRTDDRKQGGPVGDKKHKAQPADKRSEAFSILNTPKKLGNRLLRRGSNRKVTPKTSPRSGSWRSLRNTTPSKGKVSGAATPGKCALTWLEDRLR